MERRRLYAIVAVIVVVGAGLSVAAVLLLTAPPPQGPIHVYAILGDSEWFDLPAGRSTNVSAFVTDNGAPLFGIPVAIAVSPDTEGVLSSSGATTDTLGFAKARYTSYNRTANTTVSFAFTATLGGREEAGSIEVRQLGLGWQPTTARARGLVMRNTDRLAIPNATVQVNIQNMTELPANTRPFLSNNSDELGFYEVADLPPRTAFIQVVKAGYKSQRQDIALTAGKNTRVDFLMEQLTGKVLTIWHTYSGKEEDEFIKMIDRYRATRPDLNVQLEFQPFAGAPEKFIVAATAGNAPDVMRFQNDRLGEVANLGFLEQLDSRLDPATIQRFTSQTIAAMRIEGKTYALPTTQDLLAIVYNRALFTAANEPLPRDDWTTDDMIRIATNLTTPTRYGLITPQTNAFYWFPWLSGYGGRIFTVPDSSPIATDADVGLNTVEAARSVLFMQSLDKVSHLMFANPGEDPMLTEFLSGNAAMITTGPWNIPAVQRAEIDFRIAPYPIVSDTGQRAKPVLGVKGFAIWKLSSVKDDAFDFLKYITSPDQQKLFSLGDGVVPGTNDIPTAQTAFTDPAIQANPIIYRYLQQALNSSEFPSRPEMANVWGPMTDALTFTYADQNNLIWTDPTSVAALNEVQRILTQEEQDIYG